jgi:hypothetical protein
MNVLEINLVKVSRQWSIMRGMTSSVTSRRLTVEDILEAHRVDARKRLAAHRVVRQFDQGLMSVGQLITELMVIERNGG